MEMHNKKGHTEEYKERRVGKEMNTAERKGKKRRKKLDTVFIGVGSKHTVMLTSVSAA